MGNLCGKASKDDNFQGPGRTLGTAPTPATKASLPARIASAEGSGAGKKPTAAGPGRAVGTAGASGDDPRTAAAAAAEARNNKPATGDLAKKLDLQRRQTHNQTLQAAAAENRAQREVDAATETRNWN